MSQECTNSKNDGKIKLDEGQIILDLTNLERHMAALITSYNVVIHKSYDETQRQFYIGHINGIRIVMKTIQEYKHIEEMNDVDIGNHVHERLMAIMQGKEYF